MPSPGWPQPSPPPGYPGLPPGLQQLPPPGALPPIDPFPASVGMPVPAAYSAGAPARPSSGVGKSTQHFGMATEVLALIGLKELAGSLVPGQPLETTGDVARLITKLHDAVEVFCRCFIPLREGYSQFVSSMDLQRAAQARSMQRSSAYMAVEMAREPGQVAAALLNWRDQSLDAPAAVEAIFADLMIHQVALLDGVMRGVMALLDELSPANIEKNAQTGPLGLGLGRHKSLWQAYCERFEQLSEEKQAFSHIFGPDFTEAYREYRQRRSDSGG